MSGSGKRVLVAGGAGFVGAHLCERLLRRGDAVVCVDNLSTGWVGNVAWLSEFDGFEWVQGDITQAMTVQGSIDAVAHLASPASPRDYLRLPIETLAAGSRGTEVLLCYAERCQARFVLASTSEVYGDPLSHPQKESYWGNVNPVGPRSCYDEAKRFAEALTTAYARRDGLDAGIVRIFNTYGPRMRPDDGRAASNFIVAALRGEPLCVFGDGSQTRSFCYVDDLVGGLIAMVDSSVSGPVNLGNPEELRISDLAELVITLCGSASELVFRPRPVDDPTRRCPDIALAASTLNWQPRTSIEDGLARTIAWFSDTLLPAGRVHR